MASHSPAAVSPSPDQHTTTSSPPVHTTPAPVNPAPKFVQHIPDEPSSTPAKASPTPSPTNAGSGDSGSGWIFGGHGTYFYQYGRPGACGTVHQDTDFIVAMDTAQYSASICGKTVEISYQGNTVQAKVADECPTCVNGNSIDMSLATFKVLADVSVGDLVIKWRWV
jgi:expansin (peptidoglycan-binding protein)